MEAVKRLKTLEEAIATTTVKVVIVSTSLIPVTYVSERQFY